MENVSRSEFAESVSAAIASVRHFYREVDRLVVNLREVLLEEPDSLKVVRGSTGKGTSVKQQGRVVLRDEYSILFEPAEDEEGAADAAEDDGDDEEDADELEDEVDKPSGSRKRSRPAELDPDQPLLVLRLSLATQRPSESFEPSLQYAVLGAWGLGLTEAKHPGPFLLKRNMLRRITWILEKGDSSKRILTAARVIGKGKGAKSGDRTLSCRILGGVRAVALYDLDQPKALDDLAVAMKEHWRSVLEETGSDK